MWGYCVWVCGSVWLWGFVCTWLCGHMIVCGSLWRNCTGTVHACTFMCALWFCMITYIGVVLVWFSFAIAGHQWWWRKDGLRVWVCLTGSGFSMAPSLLPQFTLFLMRKRMYLVPPSHCSELPKQSIDKAMLGMGLCWSAWPMWQTLSSREPVDMAPINLKNWE